MQSSKHSSSAPCSDCRGLSPEDEKYVPGHLEKKLDTMAKLLQSLVSSLTNPKRPSREQTNPARCWMCGKPGHLQRDCLKTIGANMSVYMSYVSMCFYLNMCLLTHPTSIAEVMGWNPAGTSECFLGFIRNCFSYFTAANISFTSLWLLIKQLRITD